MDYSTYHGRLYRGFRGVFRIWSQWVAYPGNNIGIALFLIALQWHAWIGIRDVVLDYVPNVVSRMLVLTLVASVILGSALWGLKTLFLIVAI